MPSRTKPRATWRAGADRIAHASLPNATRTLCGEWVTPEPLAWPAFRRCLACASLTGEGVWP